MKVLRGGLQTAAEPTLFGLENELALGVRDPANAPKLRMVATGIISRLQETIPSLPFSEGHGSPLGLMTSNGGRIYLDGPFFIENATCEALLPEDLIACQRAGERLLLKVLPYAAQKAGLSHDDLCLTRAVTDNKGKFCGAHTNVLLRRHEATDLVDYIVPFLVTRLYACAGGWSSSGFVMSQKAASICCTVSEDTRKNRGIVNTKKESLAKPGYTRIHCAHGDALMSDWGTYLSVGCTALVLKMLDDGVSIGMAMTLRDPVSACHQLDTDFTWKQPLELKCGAEASALDIQEHYLRAAETYTQIEREPWMNQVVARWRHVVDALKRNPGDLARTLDPYIKMGLYARLLKQRDMTLAEFTRWCGAISLIQAYLGDEGLPARGVKSFLRERLPFVSFTLLEERMNKQRLSWSHLRRAIGLWHLLLHIDLEYHDISNAGLFWRLRDSGAINSRLASDEAITRAMEIAPPGTRAALRSQAIKELSAAEGGTANWSAVTSPLRRMDLSDPFTVESQWILTEKAQKGR